jgi:hypothetical protein
MQEHDLKQSLNVDCAKVAFELMQRAAAARFRVQAPEQQAWRILLSQPLPLWTVCTSICQGAAS